MVRTTRRGTEFSPYQVPNVPPWALAAFEVVHTTVSLDKILRQAMEAADERASHLDDAAGEDEWEDDEVVTTPQSSVPSSSECSPSGSCASSRSSTPLTPPVSLPAGPSLPHRALPVPSTGGIERRRNNIQSNLRRAARRQKAAKQRTPYDRVPNPRHSQAHRESAPHTVAFDLADAPVAGGGAWIGRRSKVGGRIRTRVELEAEGAFFIEWNGRDPKLIVDAEGRIIAILLGTPEDPDWADVVADAVRAMRRARRLARRHRAWSPGQQHRRGRYFLLTAGPSYGGGQRKPGNLCNSRFRRRLLRSLLQNKSIQRIIGFQSSGMAMYAPKLYRYYCKILRALFDHHPELTHNFSNSIFPAVSFNCGDAVTFEHCDLLNLPHGFCPVTCGGSFNSKESGALYLKQLGLILEFPPCATILITSGCVDHGNTPIAPDESRFSITQFAAGGLFRWVEYGFQTAKSLLAQVGGREARERFDGVPGARWRWALGLFSKYDELEADRAEVFGNPDRT
ncbi:hypothetical protein DFH06DRAFT_1190599 [Mycena polygramma]|nr:hypothetical protein DFH06DRAFT_1190599 [Mycena polygramma]